MRAEAGRLIGVQLWRRGCTVYNLQCQMVISPQVIFLQALDKYYYLANYMTSSNNRVALNFSTFSIGHSSHLPAHTYRRLAAKMAQSTVEIGSRGTKMPVIGFGTFQPDVNPESVVTEAVLQALQAGYRHIDTAWMYGHSESERGVGEALRKWGGKREDVFIVTKL